jgi:hypothetical protein
MGANGSSLLIFVPRADSMSAGYHEGCKTVAWCPETQIRFQLVQKIRSLKAAVLFLVPLVAMTRKCPN